MNFSIEHFAVPAGDPMSLQDGHAKTLDAKVVFDNGQTPPKFPVGLPGGVMLEIRSEMIGVESSRQDPAALFKRV